MPTKSSLIVKSKVEQMLAEATTIQKAKELKDMALTGADWARRMHLGDENVKNCLSYARRAEDLMGKFLLATAPQRAKGALRVGKSPAMKALHSGPTLQEMSITPHESAAAQNFHKLPEKIKEQVIVGTLTREAARRDKKREDREKRLAEREKSAKGKAQAEKVRLVKVDIMRGSPYKDGSVDAIITDPPYGKDSLSLYSALSKEAKRVLKPGGNCLVMTGQA